MLDNIQKGNCCSIAERNKLEVLCPMNVVPPSIEGVNCTCTDYMLCKLVMLIAISSNHFRESEKYFAMANAKLPNTKIIVYDLGLKKNEMKLYSRIVMFRRLESSSLTSILVMLKIAKTMHGNHFSSMK